MAMLRSRCWKMHDLYPSVGARGRTPCAQARAHFCQSLKNEDLSESSLTLQNLNGADAVNEAVPRRSSVPQDSSRLRQRRT